MSTISDALKKVQKQRTPGGMDRRPFDDPQREPPRSNRGVPTKDQGALVAIGVMSFLVVVFLAVALGRRYLHREQPSAVSPPTVVHTATVQVVVTQTVPPLASVPGFPATNGMATAAPAAPVPSGKPLPAGTNATPAAGNEMEQALPDDLPVLKGVFYSERAPVAIINESNFQEGERAGNYEVSKILPTSVIVKANGREFTLKLK